jgi:hypothetical protein
VLNTGVDLGIKLTKKVSLKVGWDGFFSKVNFQGAYKRTIILTCLNAGVTYVIN